MGDERIDGAGGGSVPPIVFTMTDEQIAQITDPTIRDVLENLKDISNLTPEEAQALLAKEKARLNRTYPDIPILLENTENITQEELTGLMTQIMQLSCVYDLIAGLTKYYNMTKEGNEDNGVKGNKWLKGTSYVAMIVAIENMAKVMSEQAAIEGFLSAKLRLAEAENIESQVKTIEAEAKMKEEQLKWQALIKLTAAVLSGFMHATTAGIHGFRGTPDAGAKIQAFMQTANNMISSFSEAVSKYVEMVYTVPLAGFEKDKVIQRDRYEAIKQMHQTAARNVSEFREALARALDQISQQVGEMRRAMQATRS